jgi:phosphatidylinositol alpha-1,6-mannosyltransferase
MRSSSRVLIYSSEFPPGAGGIGTHAWEIARHLHAFGWELEIVTPQDYAEPHAIAAFNSQQPFAIHSLARIKGSFGTFKYRWNVLSNAIRVFRPDVLLATGDRQTYQCGILARLHQLPWMAIEHGRQPARWELMLKRHYLARASVVICVSEYTKKRLCAMGVTPKAVQVIPNGADPVRFRALPESVTTATRQKLALSGNRIVATVGNVSDRKGQDLVIQALPQVLAKFPDVHYVCAGLPTNRAIYQSLAERLGVADHVHFLGPLDADAIPALLNCTDVFAMTSRHTRDQWEGYGIAVVEAALCGVPAVVSGNSGLSEAITHGETGLAVDAGNPFSTATALIALLSNEPLRRQMGEAARQRALREQTWQTRALDYHAVLQDVIYASRSGVNTGAYTSAHNRL